MLFLVLRVHGSSPRVRGRVDLRDSANRGVGFIPAWAGGRQLNTATLLDVRVHPRARGGAMYGFPVACCLEGASPRARGAWIELGGGRLRPVHPRGCGEAEGRLPALATIPGRVTRINPAVENGTVTVDVALDGDLPRGARPDLSLTDEQAEPERPEGVSGRPSWSAPRRLAVRRSAA